jgi:hypothetical protein
MDHIVREATEIDLHPNNMNRKNDSGLSKAWKPLIRSLLKDRRKPPSYDGRTAFSNGSHRTMHTGLIMARTMSSSGTHQPPFWYPDFPPLSAPSSAIACLRHFSPALIGSLFTTHLQPLPCIFLDQQNCPFSGPSQTPGLVACLFARWTWERKLVLAISFCPTGEPTGTGFHPSISLLVPI